MRKKQGAIILVLIALIICAIVTVKKLSWESKGISDNNMDKGKEVTSVDKSKPTNVKKIDFLKESKIIRDNTASQALQNLKTLIDDKHTSIEVKADLSKKYTNLFLETSNASEIEKVLKSKGFEDTLSFVLDNKVVIIIKEADKLSQDQRKQIQDVVMDKTHIKEVDIQSNQCSTESDFFKEAEAARDKNLLQELQNAKLLIDNDNTSKTDRRELSNKYTNLALSSVDEPLIETILKSKGYEEILCYIQDNKVTIMIKASEKLTEVQQEQIKGVAMDVAHLKDVEIQLKQ